MCQFRDFAVILGLVVLCQTTLAVSAVPWLTLASTAIKDGQRIAFRFGSDDQKRACSPPNPAICSCPEKNISPELACHNQPANTKRFAILMYDVDGQYGAGISHWVADNIAPNGRGLAEGDGPLGRNFIGGSGIRGNAHYMGPCPAQGDGPHHYWITLIAPDLGPTSPAGLTRDQFFSTAKGHLLARATIGGLFARQYK